MKATFRKIRWMVVLLALAMGASAYLLLYNPLYRAFRQLSLDNFILSANAVSDGAERYLDRCREGAAAMSSRTMIKRAIVAYREGKSDFEELRSYSDGPYEDGAKVIENLVGAARCVNGRIAADYGTAPKLEPGTGEDPDTDTIKLHFDFVPGPDNLEKAAALIVTSPIREGTDILGYDVLQYELSPLQKTSETVPKPGIALTIVPDFTAEHLRAGTGEPYRSRSENLIHWDDTIALARKVPGSNAAILAHAPCMTIFERGESLSFNNLLRFSIIMIALLASTNLYIAVSLHRLLKGMELSRETYRTYASHDSLTGVYTRRFLELWTMKELPLVTEAYTVVMIDVDCFKEINDSLGHEAGDAALTQLGNSIGETIRGADLAVRMGGDEFLLWLRGADTDQARTIMQRLTERLSAVPLHGRTISISWGSSPSLPDGGNTAEGLTQAIHAADQRMYEMKRAKKGE